MAHDKFYATCENKCRVDITDKVVKVRFRMYCGRLYGNSSGQARQDLSRLGISDTTNAVAAVTPVENYNIDYSYYFDENNGFRMVVTNKSSTQIDSLQFNVVIF